MPIIAVRVAQVTCFSDHSLREGITVNTVGCRRRSRPCNEWRAQNQITSLTLLTNLYPTVPDYAQAIPRPLGNLSWAMGRLIGGTGSCDGPAGLGRSCLAEGSVAEKCAQCQGSPRTLISHQTGKKAKAQPPKPAIWQQVPHKTGKKAKAQLPKPAICIGATKWRRRKLVPIVVGF